VAVVDATGRGVRLVVAQSHDVLASNTRAWIDGTAVALAGRLAAVANDDTVCWSAHFRLWQNGDSRRAADSVEIRKSSRVDFLANDQDD
jgi:hypothetical protein